MTLKISAGLIRWTAGRSEITVEGANIAEVIEFLKSNHPDLTARILKPTGGLQPFVRFFVNGQEPQLSTNGGNLKSSDELTLIAAIAGG